MACLLSKFLRACTNRQPVEREGQLHAIDGPCSESTKPRAGAHLDRSRQFDLYLVMRLVHMLPRVTGAYLPGMYVSCTFHVPHRCRGKLFEQNLVLIFSGTGWMKNLTKAAAAGALRHFVRSAIVWCFSWTWSMRPRTALRVSVCRDIEQFILSPNRDFFCSVVAPILCVLSRGLQKRQRVTITGHRLTARDGTICSPPSLSHRGYRRALTPGQDRHMLLIVVN